MAYTSPGVRITNQFQPLANPAVGGDRLLAIVGKIPTNLNLFPKLNVEARRANSNPDVITFLIPDPSLGTIPDNQRVVRIWQGGTRYNPAPADHIYTVIHGSSGGTDTITTTLSIQASGANVLAVYGKIGTSFVKYIAGTDYTFTLDNSGPGGTLKANIDWSLSGNEPPVNGNYAVVIEDSSVDYAYAVDDTMEGKVTVYVYWGTISSNKPETGSAYMATVILPFPYDRQIVTSTDEAYRMFGPVLDPTNPDPSNASSVNELAMAAYLAFNEGAGQIMLVPYDTTTLSYEVALDLLKSDDLPNIITGIDSTVIQSGNPSLNNKIINHVEDASSQQFQKFRIGILNPTVGDFNDAKSKYANMVALADSRRIIIVGPSQLTFKIPVPGTGEYVDFKTDGGYGGVILGAMMSRIEYDLATSMLRKPSRTIFKVRKDQEWDDRKLDIIAALGITLFQKMDGVYKCREDITTSQSGTIFEAEPTITMISDNIAKSAIKVLDATVIGTKLLLPTTLENIKARLISMLENKTKAPSIIVGYGSPEISVDSTDPRKINVVIPVQPVQKVREINVTFSYVASL